jgi:hypothetical protein
LMWPQVSQFWTYWRVVCRDVWPEQWQEGTPWLDVATSVCHGLVLLNKQDLHDLMRPPVSIAVSALVGGTSTAWCGHKCLILDMLASVGRDSSRKKRREGSCLAGCSHKYLAQFSPCKLEPPWLNATTSVTVLDVLANVCRDVWPEEVARGYSLIQPQVCHG